MERFQFKNGDIFPSIGFGTWQLAEGEETISSVRHALEVGYRLIDTATHYGNEVSVGKAVKSSKVDRSEIMVTTKLWSDDLGYKSAIAAFEASRKRLDLEYIDLYLIHWPASKKRLDAWQAMIELQQAGKIKHIGVSNFTVRHLDELRQTFSVLPEVNQIEFHPYVYNHQQDILYHCLANDILVESYSPLVQAKALKNDAVQSVAKNHKKSPAQVLLRWALQHRTTPLPKSSTDNRITENFNVYDFVLSGAEMQKLNKLSSGTRITTDPHELP